MASHYKLTNDNEVVSEQNKIEFPTEGDVWNLMQKHVLANTCINELFKTNENWPIEGTFWDLMCEHVLDNTDDSEKLEYIDGDSVRNIWKLGELYDKDEIVEHIQTNDIPPDAIYTPTQLSQSCGRLNAEILADNERIRTKYNELCINYNELIAKHSERILKYNKLASIIKTEEARKNAKREKLWNSIKELGWDAAFKAKEQEKAQKHNQRWYDMIEDAKARNYKIFDKTKKEECGMQ